MWNFLLQEAQTAATGPSEDLPVSCKFLTLSLFEMGFMSQGSQIQTGTECLSLHCVRGKLGRCSLPRKCSKGCTSNVHQENSVGKMILKTFPLISPMPLIQTATLQVVQIQFFSQCRQLLYQYRKHLSFYLLTPALNKYGRTTSHVQIYYLKWQERIVHTDRASKS